MILALRAYPEVSSGGWLALRLAAGALPTEAWGSIAKSRRPLRPYGRLYGMTFTHEIM